MIEMHKEAFYNANYNGYANEIYQEIRKETYDEDVGQTGWHTIAEQDLFLKWLDPLPGEHFLDIACGNGGLTLRMAEYTLSNIIGVDIHSNAILNAQHRADELGLKDQVDFKLFDATGILPCEEFSKDGIICIDAVNHFPDRMAVLKEWNRVLRRKGKILYTNPITVSGPLSNEEMKIRSSIGHFVFVPEGYDEKIMYETGFNILKKENVTQNLVEITHKWYLARKDRAEQLQKIEGDSIFEGQQEFLKTAHLMAKEGRLTRWVFIAEKI